MRALSAGVIACLGAAGAASASELTISLPDAPAVSQQIVRYQCGSGASDLGLPSRPFPVLYLNAGENHLAVLEVGGKRLVFANVYAGSGARYASGAYVWWDAAGRGASFSVEIPASRTVQCRRVAAE